MKIGKEKKVTYYHYQVTMSPEEFKILRAHGLRIIQNDDEALINYAILDGIKNHLASLPKKKRQKRKTC